MVDAAKPAPSQERSVFTGCTFGVVKGTPELHRETEEAFPVQPLLPRAAGNGSAS